MEGTGSQGRARGRGRASTQNIQQAGRRPGEPRPQQGNGQQQRSGQQQRGAQPHLQPAPQPAQPAWGRPAQNPPSSTISGVVTGPGTSSQQGPRPCAPTPAGGLGRATLHRVGGPADEHSEGAARGITSDIARGAVRGTRPVRSEIIVTRPANVVSKRGTSGKTVSLLANYFRLEKSPKWEILQYRVDFSPDVDLLHVRKALIRQHVDKFGGYLFDGTVLFITQKLAEPIEFVSKNRDGEPILIKVKFVGTISMKEGQSLQVLNLILRRAMEGLQLQLVGRNFFDANAKIDLHEYRIELWPGYTTSIRQHEQDILLCCEIAHKVMRTDKIYDILQKCVQESRDFQEAFKKEVMGMIVLTDYNNKTYRIDDIDFNQSPSSKFPMKDGSQISFVEYYRKKYNLCIKDERQPLLVSQPTERNRRGGETELILLIPELCRATGLTDEMRARFELMRAMSDHTRLAPNTRIQRLKAFNQRLYNTPLSINHLDSWQVKLDKNLVKVQGRILHAENIVFGNDRRTPSGEGADWTREFRNNSMFLTVNLTRWCIIVPKRSQREATEFVQNLNQAANGMKMRLSEPQYILLNEDRNTNYVKALEQCCENDPQLIMCVVPNNNAERYSSIKKKTCVDRAVPTQVIVHRTIAPRRGNTRGLLSVATKVIIQMNCKLMGAAWNIELPLSGLMTIGFDVCHSARDRSKSYGAMVATMDMKTSARFYSTVSAQEKGAEISNEISMSVVKALKEFRALHGTLPSRILFYRDGVGAGQFHQVAKIESEIIRKRLNEIYESANIPDGPKFAFVIVSKQINSRYFMNESNPPPGTVVDDVITLPENYDFFLVSQSVRQGTVSPTHYSIVDDNIALNPDKMQILTYKMTHLYYNWSGTTRVPAVCQYAHKLAFLVGQSIHQSPSNLLEKQLYFL